MHQRGADRFRNVVIWSLLPSRAAPRMTRLRPQTFLFPESRMEAFLEVSFALSSGFAEPLRTPPPLCILSPLKIPLTGPDILIGNSEMKDPPFPPLRQYSSITILSARKDGEIAWATAPGVFSQPCHGFAQTIQCRLSLLRSGASPPIDGFFHRGGARHPQKKRTFPFPEPSS